MKNGFIKVAAATPEIRISDTEYNCQSIIEQLCTAEKNGAKIVVFPELCITGYTCGDLLLQSTLAEKAKSALKRIIDDTKKLDVLFAVGLPIIVEDKLYNVAAICKGGKVLGIVPKSNIPNYYEFNEARYFNVINKNTTIKLFGEDVPFGSKLIFCAEEMEYLRVACEICEDLWVAIPPSSNHTLNGATVVLNLSASDETAGKRGYRRMLMTSHTARTISAYVYADAGEGESTTDLVYSGNNYICECGKVLCEADMFKPGIIYSVIDVEKISLLRRKVSTYNIQKDEDYKKIYFNIKIKETPLERDIDAHPFVPSEGKDIASRCESVFDIQCAGLKQRLKHIGIKTVTLGVSGGLDSTLALLVAVKTFDKLNLDRKGIIAVTMPCFGTTDRTYNNSKALAETLGVTLRQVNIAKSVTQHLEDIGASIDEHDVTYENAQARERTQVLMDISNKTGGIVIGTGDLSELALGFATYNGDHMSMYGVNCGVPKTLIRYLVKYVADINEGKLKEILYDILDTPVSPELLPPDEMGDIEQRTENIVGPYELHDFFLYNYIRYGFSKEKIYRMTCKAFEGVYEAETIRKWIEIFFRRFYNNQFKRSAVPDGPKVGTIGLSPRGDWRMPSDATLSE